MFFFAVKTNNKFVIRTAHDSKVLVPKTVPEPNLASPSIQSNSNLN